jgi:hypothetical protein
MEATVYQGNHNGTTSYFLQIDNNVTQVPYLSGPLPSLVNELRFHKARLMHKGEPLSVFHPDNLESRLNDQQVRILQSQAKLSIFEPPVELSSTQHLRAVA